MADRGRRRAAPNAPARLCRSRLILASCGPKIHKFWIAGLDSPFFLKLSDSIRPLVRRWRQQMPLATFLAAAVAVGTVFNASLAGGRP